MRKTNKARLQNLIIISLSSYLCNVNALDSVSSYEKSLIENAESKLKVNSNNLNQDNYDLNQLANELKKRGWKIDKENDGTLVLRPKELLKSEKSSEKTTNNETREIDPWQQIQKKFSQAGWLIEQDTDGSTFLYPKRKSTSSTEDRELNKINETINIEKNHFLSTDIQKQLKETGWNMTNNPDGSLSLYPPKKIPSDTPKPCSGTTTMVNIELPVNSWQEAHDIAQAWLQDHSINNAAVGKIRKIINVYIISIVANKSPYTLQHQVAVRSHDGAVILLN